MAKKTPPRDSRQGGFDYWWSERFDFYTESRYPFYTSYKKLHSLGADLNYVYCLHQSLKVADSLDSKPDQQPKKKSKKALKRKIREKVGDIFLKAALQHSPFEKHRPMMVELAQRINTEKQPPPHIDLTDDLRGVIRGREPHVANLILGCLFHNYSYTGSHQVPTSNARADRCGTFFLVAVTEHLRAKCGKRNYLLAGNLLRQIREQVVKVDSQQIKRTRARVKQFKSRVRTFPILLKKYQKDISNASGNQPST